MSDAEAHKSKQGRSPKYPGIGLEEAIKKARTLYEHEGKNPAPREVVMEHWGYSQKSSSGMIAVGAVRGFGLIEGTGESLRLSQLGLDIVADERPGSAERTAAIRTASLLPKIHRSIWEHFTGNLPSDPNLKHYLVRTLDFTDSGANDFLRQFRATLAFSIAQGTASIPAERRENPEGDGDDQGQIGVGDLVQWTSQGAEQFSSPRRVKSLTEDGFAFVEGSEAGLPVGQLHVTEKRKPEIPPMSLFSAARPPRRQPSMNQEVFSLSEGEATLQWPANLSPRSFTHFKAWLAIVAAKAEDASKAGEAVNTAKTEPTPE